jgi:hypothetical protein
MAPGGTGQAWSESVLRPLPELTAVWPQILARLDALDLDPQTPFEALTPRVRHLLGVHAGAAWTLGATKRAPMAWADLPVSYGTIAEEQATAVQVSKTLHDGSQDYARGVLRWMHFLLGLVNDLDLDG